jgi:hypothetical protein
MLFRRMGKEPLGGSDITPFAQEQINGSTLFIDRATQVNSLALYLNVGLIHAPGVAHSCAAWFQRFSKCGTIGFLAVVRMNVCYFPAV